MMEDKILQELCTQGKEANDISLGLVKKINETDPVNAAILQNQCIIMAMLAILVMGDKDA